MQATDQSSYSMLTGVASLTMLSKIPLHECVNVFVFDVCVWVGA